MNDAAMGEQLIECALQRLRCVSFEPLTKAQDFALVLGQPGNARQRVRHDADGLPLLPEDQNLRFGANDGVGGGEVAAQVLRLELGIARFTPR